MHHNYTIICRLKCKVLCNLSPCVQVPNLKLKQLMGRPLDLERVKLECAGSKKRTIFNTFNPGPLLELQASHKCIYLHFHKFIQYREKFIWPTRPFPKLHNWIQQEWISWSHYSRRWDSSSYVRHNSSGVTVCMCMRKQEQRSDCDYKKWRVVVEIVKQDLHFHVLFHYLCLASHITSEGLIIYCGPSILEPFLRQRALEQHTIDGKLQRDQA